MSDQPAGDIGAAQKDAPPVEQNRTATVEDDFDDVPDPDEDDLDDLDDMLEDFSSAKLDGKKPEIPTGPGRPATAGPAKTTVEDEEALDEDEFAKQLQAGMADLLGEIDNSPEMQAQFESIFKELGAAAAANAESSGDATSPKFGPEPPFNAASAAAAAAAGPGAEANFQETIRKTMERMQTSGEQATAAATAEGSDDFLAELLKHMASGEGGGGEGNEEEFTKMLLGMMDQLTNKEILYEPMKELNEKFPEWLEKNKDKTPPEEYKNYKEQQLYVSEIVTKFEEPTYADSNKTDREYILERMQKMQTLGQPPSDLVGDMPSTQDALGLPEDGCTPQ